MSGYSLNIKIAILAICIPILYTVFIGFVNGVDAKTNARIDGIDTRVMSLLTRIDNEINLLRNDVSELKIAIVRMENNVTHTRK